jgi:hypothetical protein
MIPPTYRWSKLFPNIDIKKLQEDTQLEATQDILHTPDNASYQEWGRCATTRAHQQNALYLPYNRTN